MSTFLNAANLAKRLEVSSAYISQAKKRGDSWLVFDSIRKKFNLEKTVELFDVFGGGSRSKDVKEAKSKKKKEKAKEPDKPESEKVKDAVDNFPDNIDETEADSLPTQADSRRVKEYYQAQREKLKYNIENGELVNIKDIEGVWFSNVRKLRDVLLSIPARVSMKAVGKKSHAIEMILNEEIKFALTNLKDDQPKPR